MVKSDTSKQMISFIRSTCTVKPSGKVLYHGLDALQLFLNAYVVEVYVILSIHLHLGLPLIPDHLLMYVNRDN
uniref:Uncharacterized protein n=1 Tax=Arion vulgaris TaxID=1028688 RepID=A0A0B7AUS1_9EUPU